MARFAYERLDKSQAMLIVVDHQEGLYMLTRDRDTVRYKSDVFAHAALGQIFSLPTVLTSSSETGKSAFSSLSALSDHNSQGPNGRIPAEVLAMHPNAAFVKRHGEVNAWDNADFRKAVQATGRKQVIIAGITTDVSHCTSSEASPSEL